MRHLLIVGRPGVGKTTLLKQLLQELRGCSVDGFFTEELRENGQRLGFWLSCVDGRQALLAHRDLDTPHRVGNYHVNVDLLDDLAVGIIRRATEQRAALLFLDELGTMELCSLAFQEAVAQALQRGPRIVATGSVASLPFLDAVKHRKDVELIPLSKDTWPSVREELATRLRLLCEPSEPVQALQQQIDRVSAMIASGASHVDLEIQQATLRERLQHAFPDQPKLYQMWCEQRFRRLWQQFRHG